MADPEERANRVLMASAALADLIGYLDGRGLLEGEVRTAVGEFLERFRKTQIGDTPEQWHTDLFDLYMELLGREP